MSQQRAVPPPEYSLSSATLTVHHNLLMLAQSMLLSYFWEHLWNAVTFYLIQVIFFLNQTFNSLARCFCAFISLPITFLPVEVCHWFRICSRWSEAAVHSCGVLLPTSNEQPVRMGCVYPFLYLLLNYFCFFKVFQRSVSSCFPGISLLLSEGCVRESDTCQLHLVSQMMGAMCGYHLIAAKTMGGNTLESFSCQLGWGNKSISIPTQRWKEDALNQSFPYSVWCFQL